MKIIYRPYYDWEFELFDLPAGAKMIKHQRLTTVRAYEATEKNIALANQHNEIVKQMEELEGAKKYLVDQMEKPIKR